MEESTSSENVWHKGKPEEQSELFHGESTTASVEANATSLVDIFDTAFTSTVDPSPQSRFTSGIYGKYYNFLILPHKEYVNDFFCNR